MSKGLEKLGNFLGNCIHIVGRLKSLDYIATLINQELGKVPLDRGILCIVRIFLGQDFQKDGGDLVVHVKAPESLLALQIGVKWALPLSVHLDFGKPRKLGSKPGAADIVNLIDGFRCLPFKLVGGEV